VIFAGASAAAVAHAEPTAAEKETARSLVDEGDKRIEAGDLEGALKAYRAAHAIMGVPTTGLEVAKTLAKLGRLTEAREVAIGIASAKAAAGEPRVFTDARAEADKLAERLEPRIPSLVIEVKGVPEGAEVVVRVDKSRLPTEALGLPRRVDPGKHVVTAEVAGVSPARAVVTVEEGEKKPVTLTVGGPSEDAKEPPKLPPPVATDAGAPPLAIVGFVGGGVGLVVGTLAGIGSLSKASSAKLGCHGNVCPLRNQSDADASAALADVSDVGFVIAIAGAAVGVYALVSQKPTPPPSAKASFTPYLTPFGGGAVLRF
jgi:hypothetical protein